VNIKQMVCPYNGTLVVLTYEGRVYYTHLKGRWPEGQRSLSYEPEWQELPGPLEDAVASLKEKAP
jgi:hypothetical protein